MYVAHILVDIDLRKGLLIDMIILVRKYSISQELDYSEIPVRFNCFHEHGHLARQCLLPFKQYSRNPSPKVKMDGTMSKKRPVSISKK